jgi:hypothetical protein
MTLDEVLEELLYFRGQCDGKTPIRMEEPCQVTDMDFEPVIVYEDGAIRFKFNWNGT